MIDVHSHILFGVDDGAKTLEESIALIEEASKIGYTDIVCTSHYKIPVFQNINYDKNFEILEKEIKKRNIKISIYKGNEVNLDGNILDKINDINSINNNKYILVEFSKGILYKSYKEKLANIKEQGFIPVLAHIERFPYIKMKDFIKMNKDGIVFQINIRSVKKLNKKMKFLLKNGYVQVIATDSHNIDRRNYDVEKSLKGLRKLVGKEMFCKLIYENPRKIIRGECIGLIQ